MYYFEDSLRKPPDFSLSSLFLRAASAATPADCVREKLLRCTIGEPAGALLGFDDSGGLELPPGFVAVLPFTCTAAVVSLSCLIAPRSQRYKENSLAMPVPHPPGTDCTHDTEMRRSSPRWETRCILIL